MPIDPAPRDPQTEAAPTLEKLILDLENITHQWRDGLFTDAETVIKIVDTIQTHIGA